MATGDRVYFGGGNVVPVDATDAEKTPLMIGATENTVGKSGEVRAPGIGEDLSYLRGDGVWFDPNSRIVISKLTSGSATHTFNANTTMARVQLWGGGGGSLNWADFQVYCAAIGGGGAGAYADVVFDAAYFNSVKRGTYTGAIAYTVGAAGGKGLAGGTTTFGSHRCVGGAGGLKSHSNTVSYVTQGGGAGGAYSDISGGTGTAGIVILSEKGGYGGRSTFDFGDGDDYLSESAQGGCAHGSYTQNGTLRWIRPAQHRNELGDRCGGLLKGNGGPGGFRGKNGQVMGGSLGDPGYILITEYVAIA